MPSNIREDMKKYEEQGSLHEMFIRQAKLTPTNPAVVTYDGQQINYQQLDEMSDILSKKLQVLGVKRNTVVGILMERCLEYTISYIAILKAGGAYLPLELSYPPSLLEKVMEDAQPVVVCTKSVYKSKLSGRNTELLMIEGAWTEWASDILSNTPGIDTVPNWVKVSLDDMAYTVYSSGTTGQPKGIQCPHRGAVFSYYWRHLAHPYEDNEREACNIFFVWEMFRPLCKGIPLYIIPDDVIYDPPKLIKFISDHKITRILVTPSLMQAIVDSNIDQSNLRSAFQTMRKIVFCGEVVTTLLRDKVAVLFPWIQLLNLYSVSECHDVSCADISRASEKEDKVCSVGKLLPGVHVVVMDENGNVKNCDEPGEIFVGGPTLAIGYLNKPELNAVRFIQTPPSIATKVGPRLYRTGDWGYATADGSLEIFGRCDSMVKIRGYSIEIKAVEAMLQELPMVSSCCVLAEGSEGSEKILIAYLVLKPAEPESLESKDLETSSKAITRKIRTILKTKLPFYMIPSLFVYLSSIPLNEASGKLDIKALPKWSEKEGAQLIEDDCLNATEKRVAKIWCKVLRLFTVDTEESFFDLGGHSLLAAQFVGLLNEAFNLEWPVSDLYLHPTIKSIAKRLDESSLESSSVDLMKEAASFQIDTENLDFKLRVFRKSNSFIKSKYNSCKVLVTGATGFLGAFLVDQLLKSTKTYIYCLVRESPSETPLDRLKNTFRRYNLNFGDEDSPFCTRLSAIKGDVTLENFGLMEDDYHALCYDIDVVIHAAATVNLAFPYHALYRSNVVGTRNVISFCTHSKIKPLHYISTSDVFPSNLSKCNEDSDMSEFADALESGYSQSKWVAEKSVTSANHLGAPCVIYRCGNIAGPRDWPAWNKQDLTLLILQGVLSTGYAPDASWPIELTPVEFVSKFIVSSLTNLERTNGEIFHLVNDHSYHSRNLWALLSDFGYSIKTTTFSDWSLRVKRQALACPSLKPLCYLLESALKDGKSLKDQSLFDRSNTNNFLDELNLKYPQINDELLAIYLTNLESIGLLPKRKIVPPSEVPAEKQVLQNKVILVTGASSGIGAGIGEYLAQVGAKVVITARRLDRLNILREQLKAKGITVHTMSMDVCNDKQVAKTVDEIESTIGPIYGLINNAGVMYYNFMKKGDLAEWQHTLQVNCGGVLNCLAAVLPKMAERKAGHIINITSDAGRRPFAGLAVYSATKHFVEALSGAMRAEICNDGIKVTCIQPGDVHSELRRLTTDSQAMEKFDFSDKMEILDPKDVAEACVFALTRPAHVAVNEVLIEPREAPLP
nr:PREDICTED: uncharacterized protein LOC109042518 [Bemisia tabaci]